MAVGATARDPRGVAVSWHGLGLEEADECVRRPFFTFRGFLQLRLVSELPRTTAMVLPWSEQPVQVVGVDEVEQHHPEHAEVLARWRARRSLAG